MLSGFHAKTASGRPRKETDLAKNRLPGLVSLVSSFALQDPSRDHQIQMDPCTATRYRRADTRCAAYSSFWIRLTMLSTEYFPIHSILLALLSALKHKKILFEIYK